VRTDAVAEHAFPRGSPVCAYWLARCERFAVRDGRRSAVVEQVSLDESLRAESLVVRYAFRREVVPAARVQTVVPAKELLVLERAPAPHVASAARGRIAPWAGRAGRASARTAVAAAAWGAVAAALLAQVALAYGRRAALRSARMAVSATEALAKRRDRLEVPSEAAMRKRRRRAARRREQDALTLGR
jgi:hypothetical protein